MATQVRSPRMTQASVVLSGRRLPIYLGKFVDPIKN